MGLLARIAGVGGVVALAAAWGVHVAPAEPATASTAYVPLASVLSADAYPPFNRKSLAAQSQHEVRITARAVPRMKPDIEHAALALPLPRVPREALGLSGDERPAPSGYLEFCTRHRDICSVGGAWQVALTDAA